MDKKTLINKLRGAKRSFTIWFNSVSVALIAFIEFAVPNLPDIQAQLSPYLTEQHLKLFVSAVMLANLWLRFRTNSSLESKA